MTPPDTSPDGDFVLVGRIARSHGLRGQVVVDSETDFVEDRFAPGATVLVRGADSVALRVTSMRVQGGRPIVGFDGIDTIEQAEALGRVDLWIPAASRPALPEGQFYHDALIGCRVETTAGEAVGTVIRIDGGRRMPLLVIDAPGRGEVLVPLAEPICPVIDPPARRIVIAPPDGLLDVNAITASKTSTAIKASKDGRNG